jgi:hypothetical protein
LSGWKGFKGKELRLGSVDIAVVVPVRGRPQNAAPFMSSLDESTRRARVYAVAHVDDTESVAAWSALGANVLTNWQHSFACKVNHAYQSTGEPWLFMVGDDVKFHAGWADELMRAVSVVEQSTGIRPSVIGANDLYNPRTMAGTHATHMLINRQYIADVGASWDGPGVVCHEGYKHNFVDDEMVTKAKQQPNAFVVAMDAIVEHMHPAAGKAEVDATYEIGAASINEDQALFARRMQANKR